MPVINNIFGLMLIGSLFLNGTDCQCNGLPKESVGRTGSIEYPGGRGYEDSARCVWQFLPLDEEYILILRFVDLRIRRHWWANEECHDLLEIKNEKICKRDIFIGRGNQFCKAYYTSTTCDSMIYSDCETSEKISIPPEVTFLKNDLTSRHTRFKMDYQFIRCPSTDCFGDDEDCSRAASGVNTADTDCFGDDEDCSAAASGENTTDTEVATTDLEATTNQYEIPEIIITNQATVDQTAIENHGAPENQSLIPIIAMGAVIFILLIIIAVLLFLLISWHRQRAATEPDSARENVTIPLNVISCGSSEYAAAATSCTRMTTSPLPELPGVAYDKEGIPALPNDRPYENVCSRGFQAAENPYLMPM